MTTRDDPDAHPRDPDDPRGAYAPPPEAEASGKDAGGGPLTGFLASVAKEIRNAGATAERYARIGVSKAQIEKLRYDLRSAYAALGEAVLNCWHDAPHVGVISTDPAVQSEFNAVKKLRTQVREIEAKIAGLRSKSKA